jgi:hypothetical protein
VNNTNYDLTVGYVYFPFDKLIKGINNKRVKISPAPIRTCICRPLRCYRQIIRYINTMNPIEQIFL